MPRSHAHQKPDRAFNRHRKARGVLEICPRERFVVVSVYFPRVRQAYGEAKLTSNALFCEI